ncbi:MAG: hypothetical protein ABJA71_16000 [Ginsengibacter sp.]
MNCNSKQDYIETDPIIKASKVAARINGKKYLFSKKDFFGYMDCDNKNYRFYKDQSYEIIDTAGFLSYAHPERSIKEKGICSHQRVLL